MPSPDLQSFLARAAALVDSSPPTTRRETRAWLVEPFLETLGWELRAESCATDRLVDETRLEYVPRIDSVPALFVAVEGYEESLDESRANALRSAMAWTGVDRAIYTNGRHYLLLAGTTDVEYQAFRLSELANAESAMTEYARASIGRRLEHHTRTHVARQLAVERPRLVDSIVDLLTDATVQGDVYAGEFESATDRFIDKLVVAFTADGPERPATTGDVSIRFDESAIGGDGPQTSTGHTDSRAEPRGDDRSDDAIGSDAAETSTDRDHTESNPDATGADRPAATETTETDGSANPTAPNDESDRPDADGDGDADDEREHEERSRGGSADGEYVVRFFNDRGSIGAIGHSTPEGALVEAAEYLLERGLSGIEVPWSPTDADETILNAEPVHADGSPMGASAQLSNGLYLRTTGDVDDRADRVEALAARAGLRAMLTGDWDATE
ncbi:hypothetical protein [Natrinema salaciae]|uniref:Restriction endonuclease n=1 Tax=Natrinema salaciae TaxID=1186196 RepID=A0A1H9FYU2_9EURY|nr:hypothetical protein [Natrinema salaciae]SEQ42979.1 hypothetical protein SAMN04489841_1718 [Natrinema salaciae]